MKYFVFILLLCTVSFANGQILQSIDSYGFSWKRGQFDVFLNIPSRCDTVFTVADRSKLRNGSYFWNNCESAFYYFSNNRWRFFKPELFGNGGLPEGGFTDQVLTKASSANGDATWSTIDKSFIGLENVDNTSDVNKPLSLAQDLALQSRWSLLGNADIDPAVNFLGTTTDHPLIFKTNNLERGRILHSGGFVWGSNTSPVGADIKIESNEANFSAVSTSIQGPTSGGTVNLFSTGDPTVNTRYGAVNFGATTPANSGIGASIEGITVGNGYLPGNIIGGRLIFKTRANGSQLKEVLRISEFGNVGINMNGVEPCCALEIMGNSRIVGVVNAGAFTSFSDQSPTTANYLFGRYTFGSKPQGDAAMIEAYSTAPWTSTEKPSLVKISTGSQGSPSIHQRITIDGTPTSTRVNIGNSITSLTPSTVKIEDDNATLAINGRQALGQYSGGVIHLSTLFQPGALDQRLGQIAFGSRTSSSLGAGAIIEAYSDGPWNNNNGAFISPARLSIKLNPGNGWSDFIEKISISNAETYFYGRTTTEYLRTEGLVLVPALMPGTLSNGQFIINTADNNLYVRLNGVTKKLNDQAGNGIPDPGTNGFLARSATNTAISRTITGTDNLISVANGDGVSGNPVISIGQNVVQTSGNQNIGGNKIFTQQLSVLKGGGLSANPNDLFYVGRNEAGNYYPLFTLQDNTPNGYVQFGIRGTGKTFHIGLGNNEESFFNVANKFFVYDDNAQSFRFVVDQNGNLGIGTVSPLYKLHVDGDGLLTGKLRLGNVAEGSITDSVLVKKPDGEISKVPANGGVKVYTALLSQSNSENDGEPTAIVLQNTLGTPIQWIRENTGVYVGLPNIPFPENKTFFVVTPGVDQITDGTRMYAITRNQYGTISLSQFITPGVLGDTFSKISIEIRVYP